MIPSRTHMLLGTSVAQARRNDPNRMFAVTGNDLNDLRALAMRLSYSFTDPNEKRDWQNRINLILDQASSFIIE